MMKAPDQEKESQSKTHLRSFKFKYIIVPSTQKEGLSFHFISLLCYILSLVHFEIGASKEIHKTVNPVAYENTYYLEGDQITFDCG